MFDKYTPMKKEDYEAWLHDESRHPHPLAGCAWLWGLTIAGGVIAGLLGRLF